MHYCLGLNHRHLSPSAPQPQVTDKYNQQQLGMSGVNAINYILDHIVKEGKTILKDKSVGRQKVPLFVSSRSVIHEGNQHQPAKKFGCFSLQKDSQPQVIGRDTLGPTRLKIDKHKAVKPLITSPQKASHKPRIYASSGLKAAKFKSDGFKAKPELNRQKVGQNRQKGEQNRQEKQNGLVKLEDDNRNRRVIERVRLRESMEEEQLRAQKQKVLLRQYEEKKANEVFEKEKNQRYHSKERLLNGHTKKGEDHSFYFDDEGEAILFRQSKSNLKSSHVPSARFLFDSEAESGLEVVDLGARKPYLGRKQFQSAKNMNEWVAGGGKQEDQRIRSAKGEAFASSVLKTLNLSRISVKQSLRQLEVEQFMKRNDLFNNNHTRQTTSIPYLQPKPGTVYTELSTNQILTNDSNRPRSSSKKSYNENPRVYSRRKSHFSPLADHEYRATYKTQRKFDKVQWNNSEESKEGQPRNIKTAEEQIRRAGVSSERPHTSSVSRGKITTVNEELVLALIE